MEDRLKKSESTQVKLVMPVHLNSNNYLFGGIAMKWMDEVAFITATRFLRKKLTTVSVENIKFIHAINIGDIIEISGKISNLGAVKMNVKVDVYRETRESDISEKVIEANFILAIINENGKPMRLEK